MRKGEKMIQRQLIMATHTFTHTHRSITHNQHKHTHATQHTQPPSTYFPKYRFKKCTPCTTLADRCCLRHFSHAHTLSLSLSSCPDPSLSVVECRMLYCGQVYLISELENRMHISSPPITKRTYAHTHARTGRTHAHTHTQSHTNTHTRTHTHTHSHAHTHTINLVSDTRIQGALSGH